MYMDEVQLEAVGQRSQERDQFPFHEGPLCTVNCYPPAYEFSKVGDMTSILQMRKPTRPREVVIGSRSFRLMCLSQDLMPLTSLCFSKL